MSPTIHEDAAMEDMEESIKDPYWVDVLAQVTEGIKDGSYTADYIDPIGQPGRGWKPEQVWAFTKIHALSQAGRLARVTLRIGDTPHADSRREQNAAALSNLRDSFVAHVDMHQHGADSDGYLEWTDPIVLRSPGMPRLSIPAGQLPLEIGTTMASRTQLHLYMHGGVARWPYGHDAVTLLIQVPRWEDPDHRNPLGIDRETDADDEAAFLKSQVDEAVEMLRSAGLRTAGAFLERSMVAWELDRVA
jgi:hypothetical protein